MKARYNTVLQFATRDEMNLHCKLLYLTQFDPG